MRHGMQWDLNGETVNAGTVLAEDAVLRKYIYYCYLSGGKH